MARRITRNYRTLEDGEVWEDNMAIKDGSQTWVAQVPSNLNERRELHRAMAHLMEGNAQGVIRVMDNRNELTGEEFIWRIELPRVDEAVWDDRGRVRASLIVEGDPQNPQGLRAEYPFHMTLMAFFGPLRDPRSGLPPDETEIEREMPGNAYDPHTQKGYALRPSRGDAPIFDVEATRLDNYNY